MMTHMLHLPYYKQDAVQPGQKICWIRNENRVTVFTFVLLYHYSSWCPRQYIVTFSAVQLTRMHATHRLEDRTYFLVHAIRRLDDRACYQLTTMKNNLLFGARCPQTTMQNNLLFGDDLFAIDIFCRRWSGPEIPSTPGTTEGCAGEIAEPVKNIQYNEYIIIANSRWHRKQQRGNGSPGEICQPVQNVHTVHGKQQIKHGK
jgi:hypothetical protein